MVTWEILQVQSQGRERHRGGIFTSRNWAASWADLQFIVLLLGQWLFEAVWYSMQLNIVNHLEVLLESHTFRCHALPILVRYKVFLHFADINGHRQGRTHHKGPHLQHSQLSFRTLTLTGSDRKNIMLRACCRRASPQSCCRVAWSMENPAFKHQRLEWVVHIKVDRIRHLTTNTDKIIQVHTNQIIMSYHNSSLQIHIGLI